MNYVSYANSKTKKSTSTEASTNRFRRHKKPKGRSTKTNTNKLNRLSRFYDRMYKESSKSKVKTPKRTKPYFCDKYSTFEEFRKVNPVKGTNAT